MKTERIFGRKTENREMGFERNTQVADRGEKQTQRTGKQAIAAAGREQPEKEFSATNGKPKTTLFSFVKISFGQIDKVGNYRYGLEDKFS